MCSGHLVVRNQSANSQTWPHSWLKKCGSPWKFHNWLHSAPFPRQSAEHHPAEPRLQPRPYLHHSRLQIHFQVFTLDVHCFKRAHHLNFCNTQQCGIVRGTPGIHCRVFSTRVSPRYDSASPQSSPGCFADCISIESASNGRALPSVR